MDPARLNEALIGRNGPDEANAEYKSLQKRHKRYLILALISVTILAAGCIACAVVAVVHLTLLRSWGNRKQTGSQSSRARSNRWRSKKQTQRLANTLISAFYK